MGIGTRTRTPGRALVVAAALAAGLLGAGTSSGAAAPGAVPGAVRQAPAGGSAPALDDTCDTAKSLPPARNAGGARIRKIRERGTLVVGVDQNSYNWGYRNPQSGRIEGFDIDLARAVAASVLGDPEKITYRTVPTARRIEAVKAGEVDMLIRTVTITCDRLKEISFSAPYFEAGQRTVTPKAAKATSVAQALKGKRACSAAKTSSATELESGKWGQATTKLLDNQLDCLVLMQQGQVDVTLTDGVAAYAQAAQDPRVEVSPDTIVPAWMGIAVNQGDPDLVAWINAVLAEYRSNGGWKASYDRWLAPTMGPVPGFSLPS
ncbi:glutamate ABC transporter substrate-binding protein [Kitasatospora camelliae]|uniref:Glutamate ABC transporter substrate-binding protein n=1 Tax=Kitasatospora camelliae TaxID=3156397 RepID=A0AAU8K0V7_9ACTN